MKHDFYFGTYSVYEDYYAIGETVEEVKTILWKMYVYNCYNKPTKEDRRIFEEEVYIRKIKGVQAFGYNTAHGESYTLKANKLTRTEQTNKIRF